MHIILGLMCQNDQGLTYLALGFIPSGCGCEGELHLPLGISWLSLIKGQAEGAHVMAVQCWSLV